MENSRSLAWPVWGDDRYFSHVYRMGRELKDDVTGMFLLSSYIADEGNKTGIGTHLAVILVLDVSQTGLGSSQTKAGSPI